MDVGVRGCFLLVASRDMKAMITKRLIEIPGGTIEAKRRGRGKRSEFIVRLPLQAGIDKGPMAALAKRPMAA